LDDIMVEAVKDLSIPVALVLVGLVTYRDTFKHEQRFPICEAIQWWEDGPRSYPADRNDEFL
jgi:hypothetical protein